MSYQALYRKYRPNDFDDVVGQDAIVNTLKNALKLDKTSHAYMFFGPRGIGKTTIAKILAKSLNCLDYSDFGCCGKCKNCLSISGNRAVDIIEIDAASNNGVDEIREIRNKINLVSTELKYKVYIIDEVHMLSIGAFNALLKTLEEPPKHVVFILATTDPQKVPVTIVSRCQCFQFKRIPVDTIVNKLVDICNIEKIDIDTKVLEKIAYLSDGGMRDALSMLDRISSFSSEKITIEKFNEINNLVDNNLKKDFINNVYSKNIVELLKNIDYMYSCGKDLIIFCEEIMEILRDDMINYYLNDESIFEIKFIVSFIEYLNKLLFDIKTSNNIKIMFETSILSYLSSFENSKNNNKIIESNNKNDEEIITTTTSSADESNIGDVSYNDVKNTIVNNTFATAQKKFLIDIRGKWDSFNDYVLNKSYGAIASFMLDTTVRAVGDKDMIITYNFESGIERGIEKITTINELVEKVLGSYYNVALLTNDEWNLEREKFIDSKNNGTVYTYKSIDNVKIDNKIDKKDDIIENDIVSQAVNLFGNDIVKIDN